MRKTALIAVLCLALSLVASLAQARVYIDITQPFSRKLPLALPVFQPLPGAATQDQGAQATDLLQRYLGYTGLFDFINRQAFLGTPEYQGVQFPKWAKVGAELLIAGNYQEQGGIFTLELRLYDVVDGRLMVGRRYDGRQGDIPAMLARFADEVMLALTGERSIFSTMIAFVGARQIGTGNTNDPKKGKQGPQVIKEIYLMRFDGTGVRKVTERGDISLYPAWKEDGSMLTYSSYVNRRPAVFVQALAGGSGRMVVNQPGVNISPAFVPRSSDLAVAMSYTGQTNIYQVGLNGKVVRQLTDGRGWGIDVQPSFSPDGTKVAYTSDRSGSPQIYVTDLNSGSAVRITYGKKYCSSPAWSPKGDRIAFQAMDDGVFQIGTVRPDGSGGRILTSGFGSNEDPTWSPDGRLIAYSSKQTGQYQIYIMTAEGQPLTRLTNLPGNQTDPAWSPQGIMVK